MIWYLPLEPYRERYTEQLLDWTRATFDRRRVRYAVVHGERLPQHGEIKTGQVLDAHGRSYWALTQTAQLVQHFDQICDGDWVFFDDMFHPGFEALLYILSQTDRVIHIAVRNWAQSYDPDDFTFEMRWWMRHYENMVMQTADVVFVASTIHKKMIEAATHDSTAAHVEVVGLPFDSAAVRAHTSLKPVPWAERLARIVYSSRLDIEKQPHLFMDLVEQVMKTQRAAHGELFEFVVCTGASELRSNDSSVVPRLRALEADEQLRIAAGLTKTEYYNILSRAKVHINTARQDFVSFTALEASAFEVPTLAPAYRAFPEALCGRATQLYVPWNLADMELKLRNLLAFGEPACVTLAEEHDATLDHMIDYMQEHGDEENEAWTGKG